MTYSIDAKPTTYAGVRFRSQLEACWAAFFDEAGMPWEYEPVHLPGWVPDFRLYGRFLCEVKPIEMTGFAAGLDRWVQKAVREQTALVFGARPRSALAAMVSGRGGLVMCRSVFFDPNAEFKMRSIAGDGGSHPLAGSAEFVWRKAHQRLRPTRRCMTSSFNDQPRNRA